MTSASRYHSVLAAVGFYLVAAGDSLRYLVGWIGWAVVILAVLALAVVELVRRRIDLRRMPLPLIHFAMLITASIAWSHYPGAGALGVVATLATLLWGSIIATLLSWSELVRALSNGIRAVLGLSLLFELVVALFIRQKVLPVTPNIGVDYESLDKIPNAFYWSRNLLFEGGRIQGVMGNANLLAFVALIGLIVFAVEWRIRERSRRWSTVWIAIAVACLALTRSSTVVVALIAVIVLGAFLLLVRRATGTRQFVLHLVGIAVLAAGVIAAILFRAPLLRLLGRSADLTNRVDIWDSVLGLAAQRPFAGWGFIGYWAPWVDPFDHLAVIKGVTYLQAHNAWIDLFFQVGALGVIVFGALVLSTFVRSWAIGLDRDPRAAVPWPLNAVAPLVMVALIVQSLAESRLLVEFSLTLLVVIAVGTRKTLFTEAPEPPLRAAVGGPASGTAPSSDPSPTPLRSER